MAREKCRRTLAFSITDGRTVRDLFENGFFRFFEDWQLLLFTEAARVPEFVARWKQDNLRIVPFPKAENNGSRKRAFAVRRMLAQTGSSKLVEAWCKLENRFLYQASPELLQVLKQANPSLVMATHTNGFEEQGLIACAERLGIPTLGLVRSWDNIFKGIRCRPQNLAVWNPVNAKELIDYEAFPKENISIIGSPAFDIYFSQEMNWSREKLAQHYNLAPDRPILFFASLGYFVPGFDETVWMDELLQLIERDPKIAALKPQIICRLHPWSRLEHFIKYQRHPDVRLSFVDRYTPTLTWTMTREDMIVMGNSLKHADVVITPGSTVLLESAIFDRPTLFPVFHSYQPEAAESYFRTYCLTKHYQALIRDGLVEVIRSKEDFAYKLQRAIEFPEEFKEAREEIVRRYVFFKDGNTNERLSNLVKKLAKTSEALSESVSEVAPSLDASFSHKFTADSQDPESLNSSNSPREVNG